MSMQRHFAGTDGKPSYNKQKTVAIIEDERQIVELYINICESMGLKIAFIAYDGGEGLEAFQKSLCPDIILIDHRMPALTGLEAMKAMLEIEPGARFIFLSASEEIREDSLEAGARAFLKKPVFLAEIKSTIMKVLNET
jgi:two-component system chemotaxis response regulator CheY